MKPRINPFFRHSATIALCIALTGIATAAQITWEGDTDNQLLNAANWPSDTLPSLSADTWQINGLGSVNTNPTLNVSSPLTFTGITGKLAFGATSGSMGLSGSDITLFQGTTGDAIRTDSTGTTTLASNIILGDGSDALLTNVTYTLSSTSITTGLLKITGNISGGTKPGPVTVSFGSTGTINGNYEVTGNITAGDATRISITKRGSGVLTLSGTNTVGNGSSAGLGQNEASSTIRITGGTTNLNNGADSHWGGLNVAGVSPVVRISGGILNAQSARNIRNSLLVDGGTLNIGAAGGTGRLSFDYTNGNKSFELSSGAINYLNDSTSGSNQGVRLGNDSGANAAGNSYAFTGVQTGGTFTVHGRGALNQTFNLGTATGGFANSYTLSGGTLDIRGSVTASVADNNAYMLLGADVGGTGSAVFTLSDSGKLIVRSNAAQGIVGAQAGAAQVLDLQGGTLVAGRIDATNLRSSLAGTNGTIVNNGTTFAPGDVGTVGRTSIVGNLTLNSGTLSFDLGGTTASNIFQEAANSGKFDNITVSGTTSLGGNLAVSLVDGFSASILNSYTFTLLTSTTSLTGEFSNVDFDDIHARIFTTGNEGSFKVTKVGNTVQLSDWSAIPEPSTAIAGLLLTAGMLRRRRS